MWTSLSLFSFIGLALVATVAFIRSLREERKRFSECDAKLRQRELDFRSLVEALRSGDSEVTSRLLREYQQDEAFSISARASLSVAAAVGFIDSSHISVPGPQVTDQPQERKMSPRPMRQELASSFQSSPASSSSRMVGSS